MSGFDLPPITGWDRSARARLGDPATLLGGQQGPEGPRGFGIGPQDGVLPPLETGPGKPSGSFTNALADSLQQVKSLQDDVQQKVRGLVLGEDVELHDVLIAGDKSEAAFNLLLEVRNKLVDAWQTLSRSSV